MLPQVQAGLTALLQKMQEEWLKVRQILWNNSARSCCLCADLQHALHLQLAAGIGLEGGFRPESYRPFCPHEWLANYLLQHKPGQPAQQSADAGIADNDAAAQRTVAVIG